MERRNTRDIILKEALKLFSVYGYQGVSVRQIAKAVGIRESSMYKHYKNKKDIFDSIIQEMSARFAEKINAMGFPEGEMDRAVTWFQGMDTEALVSYTTEIFLFFLQNEYAASFRRMLTIEQFSNSEAQEALVNFFIQEPLVYQEQLFRSMTARGDFKENDPGAMALQFYSPIFLLLSRFDNKPEELEQGKGMVRRHVLQFVSLYSPK